MTTVVHFGRGENTVLSNFDWARFEFRGGTYSCAEAAYQSWKTGRYIPGFEHKSGFNAKKAGRGIAPNKDITRELMKEIIQAKFEQVPEFRDALLDTDEIEHPVHDRFWSVAFPEILMEVRDGSKEVPNKVSWKSKVIPKLKGWFSND